MIKFKDVKFGNDYLETHKYDISAEKYRTYWSEGERYFTIKDPIALGVSETGNHRIVDINGICYRVPMTITTVIEWENEGDIQANF